MREAKDYKSRLQEETQRLFQARPVYVLTGTEGPEHEKVFEVRVTLPDESGFEASGTSVKKAEQNAARKALELLGTQKPGHQEPDGA
jgi:ribonuclease-3